MLKSYIHKFNALFISVVTVPRKTYPLLRKTDRMAGKGHFQALQNQEKRSIRASETHKNPQECAYLQPIFQNMRNAMREKTEFLAEKEEALAARTKNACRKDGKRLPQSVLKLSGTVSSGTLPDTSPLSVPLPPRFPFRQNDTETAFFPTRPGTPSARPPRRSGRMSAKAPQRLTLRLPSAPRESRIRTRLPTRTRMRDSPKACA